MGKELADSNLILIQEIIDNSLNNSHSVLLSMSVDEEKLKGLGLFTGDIEKGQEILKNRLIGIYDFCQKLDRAIKGK